ncbi:type II toxin-antitoxin system VapB family antitoxin [Synechococcus sp. BMK-MC-1]|uniref:type II toxin-antitoxin system VapB family antitoxin n=1 Tax=Synechococcus sp. BMK-MC-1 TaxID=1442551 RepID=UPI00272C055D|nr:type II toxin-antitoxin system VapB family antitoxin [Synechococcus sp. BMK-MC-1]
MALNIRNPEADRLAAQVACLAGETKTDAVILALKERLQRLSASAIWQGSSSRQPQSRRLLLLCPGPVA